MKKGEGRAVFTSSKGDQKSWIRSDGKLSIYTYHLLEALQGAGNQPGDEVVKVSNLMNYVSETVPKSTKQEYQKEQTPFYKFAAEDFPVALLRGGKGLPKEGLEGVKSEAQEKIQNINIEVTDSIIVNGDRNKVAQGNNNIQFDEAGDVSITQNYSNKDELTEKEK